MRRGAAALALLAAMSVLLQPVCAAYELRPAAPHPPVVTLVDAAAQGTDDCAPCCSEIEASAFAAPSSSGVAKAILAAEAGVPLSHAAVAPIALMPHAQPAAKAPPPFTLPYHARSARIQR